MSRSPFSWTAGRFGAWVLFAALVHAGASGVAVGASPADAGALARAMADRVRELGDALAAEVGQTETGAVAVRDARELAMAATEFSQALPAAPDALRRRQLYAGVESGWHHLRNQLARAGGTSPAVTAA